MATTKKAATKKAVKKHDNIYWVVSYRKFISWKAHSLYHTEDTALAAERMIEELEGVMCKTERVELIS